MIGQIKLDGLDFVFVESAWNGNSRRLEVQAHWAFGAGDRTSSNCSPNAVVEGLPTVFWNKEDPPHFEDFLPLAKLVDVVFTSDVRLVTEYRSAART